MKAAVVSKPVADREALKHFVEQEMARREMKSVRQFARLTGVSAITLGRILAEETEPTNDTLLLLAVGTNTDIGALMRLVYPDASRVSGHPASRILSERIALLPEDKIQLLDAFVMTLLSQQGGKDP